MIEMLGEVLPVAEAVSRATLKVEELLKVLLPLEQPEAATEPVRLVVPEEVALREDR